MVASLIFEVVAGIPAEQRTKPISVVCTETRVEPERSGDSPPHLHSDFSGQIPAISDMVTGTLDQMRRFAESHSGEARPTDVVQQLYGIFPWVSFRIE